MSVALCLSASCVNAAVPDLANGSVAQKLVAEAKARIRARQLTKVPLTSRHGLRYDLLISTPAGHPPARGFPVIYILDGDAWFGAAVEIARMREWSRLSPAIVVGIGYPSGAFFDGPRRTYDFTPPASVDEDMEGLRLGGAGEFLQFIDDILKPWVRAHRAVDPQREYLFGHSLGGLFVLYAAYTAPQSFAAYAAASPDTRFGHGAIRPIEPSASGSKRLQLLVTAGEFESLASPGQLADYRRYLTLHPEARRGKSVEEALADTFAARPGPDKIGELKSLVERLQNKGFAAQFAQFQGEEHTASAIDALNRAIPFFLRQPD
jgi:uncharacterized protein